MHALSTSFRALLVGALLCSLSAVAEPPTPPDEDKQPAAQQPKAVKSPEVEKVIKQAMSDWVTNFPKKPAPTVMRTFILSPDWGMNRTAAGIITGRVAEVVMFVKGGESGRCTKRLCNLRQEEQAGKWGLPTLECVEQYSQRVSCKSVDALSR